MGFWIVNSQWNTDTWPTVHRKDCGAVRRFKPKYYMLSTIKSKHNRVYGCLHCKPEIPGKYTDVAPFWVWT